VTGASGCPAADEAVGWLVAEPAVGCCADVPVAVAVPAVELPAAEPVLEEAFWVPVLFVPPELVPLGLAPAAAEPDCPVRACDAVLTVEPTTELAVETGESAEELAGPGGGRGSVAACACRENTSMMKKIPAARIASCTAR
jgi:hypothetical protein